MPARLLGTSTTLSVVTASTCTLYKQRTLAADYEICGGVQVACVDPPVRVQCECCMKGLVKSFSAGVSACR